MMRRARPVALERDYRRGLPRKRALKRVSRGLRAREFGLSIVGWDVRGCDP
jgi:hypothetical protein